MQNLKPPTDNAFQVRMTKPRVPGTENDWTSVPHKKNKTHYPTGIHICLKSLNKLPGTRSNCTKTRENGDRSDYPPQRITRAQPRYETAYACEGKTLKIGCGEGSVIHLIRANYGRFSITICNDHGNTEWSVNCMSNRSLRVLHSSGTYMFAVGVTLSVISRNDVYVIKPGIHYAHWCSQTFCTPRKSTSCTRHNTMYTRIAISMALHQLLRIITAAIQLNVRSGQTARLGISDLAKRSHEGFSSAG
ncbi:Latrophilin Cirl [Eumeta japonica]|uniref:Latrophilin Cirl n=1 Tax=Eumeta variegata TaxID=151549 RepID=A0A4C1TYI5_EUMVA|nr:Latrophilin Cirl [Eumeta japonica]